MVRTIRYASPVGELQLADWDGGLQGLWIAGQTHYLESLRDRVVEEETPVLRQTKAWLDRYFAGEQPPIAALPLAPVGSPFQQLVWQRLCQIPYGQLTTYGQLAKELAAAMGKPRMSAQAVGGAVGHNPISIIIPCHRVVGAGGNLTGYAGGIGLKVKLLTHEGVDMTGLFVPKKAAL